MITALRTHSLAGITFATPDRVFGPHNDTKISDPGCALSALRLPNMPRTANQIDDLKTLIATDRRAAAKVFERYYSKLAQTLPDEQSRSTREECLRDLKDPRFNILIVQRGGQVVGGLQWWELNCKIIVEEQIWADASCRGQGIGEALDRTLQHWAKASGASWLISEMLNPARAGYSAAERRENEARRRFFDAMGRKLLTEIYSQGPLRQDAQEVDNMVLTVQPTHPGSFCISQAAYRDFLTEYFSAISPDFDHTALIDRQLGAIARQLGSDTRPIFFRPLSDLKQ